jgi:dTDP-4-dehydrorhamnose 3,5-epimerase
LALANPAWRPDDDEMKNVTFDDYDWKKWKKK